MAVREEDWNTYDYQSEEDADRRTRRRKRLMWMVPLALIALAVLTKLFV